MAMSCASCSPHTCGIPSQQQMFRVAVLPRARSARWPHLATPLGCFMRRTNSQHSTASLAAVDLSRAHITSSVPRLALGSLFYSSADGLGAIMSSALGASGSASNEPSATRRQLDQLFMILWKDENIATEHRCDIGDLAALECEYDCGWIGYCYYTVSKRTKSCVP